MLWDPWHITLGVLSPGDSFMQWLLLRTTCILGVCVEGSEWKSIVAHLFRHNNKFMRKFVTAYYIYIGTHVVAFLFFISS